MSVFSLAKTLYLLLCWKGVNNSSKPFGSQVSCGSNHDGTANSPQDLEGFELLPPDPSQYSGKGVAFHKPKYNQNITIQVSTSTNKCSH